MDNVEGINHNDQGSSKNTVVRELPGGRFYVGPEVDLPEYPDQDGLDAEIANLHIKASSLLKKVENEIKVGINSVGNKIDPQGFYIIGFNAEKVTPDEVMDIDDKLVENQADNIENQSFEIGFHLNEDGQEGDIITFNTGIGSLHLRAMKNDEGYGTIVGERLEIGNVVSTRFLSINQENGTQSCNVVTPESMSDEESLDSRYEAYWKLGEINEILAKLTNPNQNSYHLRIFGSQGLGNTPQEPAFIIAGGGILPSGKKI